MKNIILNLIPLTFRTLERFAPYLSNRLALWFFFRPMRRPRPSREHQVFAKAKLSKRSLSGFYPRSVSESYYVAYEWGDGPTVLLVHGWAGRATQFHGLIETLVDRGYKVVSFDAPAHGDTPGKRTNLLEFGEILRDLNSHYGEFEGIVAHSFGAVAAVRGLVLDQLPAKRFVSLGAPARMKFILEGFARQVSITERSLDSIKEFLNGLATNDMEDFSFITHSPKLRQQHLIFHDEKDQSVPFGEGELIATASPKSEFVPSNGLGHNRLLSDPATVARIADFLGH